MGLSEDALDAFGEKGFAVVNRSEHTDHRFLFAAH
jgi:hypothetical protein